MGQLYAFQILKPDLPLINLLNTSETVIEYKANRWFIFEMEDDGFAVKFSEVLDQRDMYNKYDFSKQIPFLVRLKKYKGGKTHKKGEE
jgi:hypothetical protein